MRNFELKVEGGGVNPSRIATLQEALRMELRRKPEAGREQRGRKGLPVVEGGKLKVVAKGREKQQKRKRPRTISGREGGGEEFFGRGDGEK